MLTIIIFHNVTTNRIPLNKLISSFWSTHYKYMQIQVRLLKALKWDNLQENSKYQLLTVLPLTGNCPWYQGTALPFLQQPMTGPGIQRSRLLASVRTSQKKLPSTRTLHRGVEAASLQVSFFLYPNLAFLLRALPKETCTLLPPENLCAGNPIDDNDHGWERNFEKH